MSNNPYQPPTIVAGARPSKSQGKVELASLGQRFAGAFIDSFVMLTLMLLIGFLLLFFGIDVIFPKMNSPTFDVAFIVVGFVIGQVVFLAVQGYLLATRGQTIGKYILQTRIVDKQTHQIPDFFDLYCKRYLLLALIANIPFVGSPISLINVLFIFRENRKCLHDEIAGTQVVICRR